jgi:hypothetical protein
MRNILKVAHQVGIPPSKVETESRVARS